MGFGERENHKEEGSEEEYIYNSNWIMFKYSIKIIKKRSPCSCRSHIMQEEAAVTEKQKCFGCSKSGLLGGNECKRRKF